MSKEIFKSYDLDEKVIQAVDFINDPIRQTMSPQGGYVIYEDNVGVQHYTKDGVTIARNISHEDPIINQTLLTIRDGSLATNQQAGDGTSSTVLMSAILIKEGLRLIKNGWNPIDIRKQFLEFGASIKDIIKKQVNLIKTDNDLYHIANVSSGNIKEITENTVKTIKITGKEGQVMIDPAYALETYLIEDTGFVIQSGIFIQELAQNKSMQAKYENVLFLVTDKRLYYDTEAEKILTVAKESGYKSVVIVASDFIGEALPFFVEQHQRGLMQVLLVKETKPEILTDLAVYLNTEVISDKSGTLDNLEIKDFSIAKMVFSNQIKTIISRDKKEKNTGIALRVKAIEKEMKSIGNKDDLEYKKLERRIASLTKGMVTIKVGGKTIPEINEKIMTYEDAVNATRVSLESGYVIGGGITTLNAWNKLNKKNLDREFERVYDKYCKAILNQVSENCGVNPEVNLERIKLGQDKNGTNWGYNAVTNKVEDLHKAGVIEPYKVTTQVIDNSISIANIILTSRYRIINKVEKKKDE